MRIVKRNRYYCEFCGKGGGQSASMKKHESRCTLNPDRECGVHLMLELGTPPKVAKMIELLPDESSFHLVYENAPDGVFSLRQNELQSAVDKAMPALKELTENCPACILAAFRQSKIPFSFSGLDYGVEMNKVWYGFWHEKNLEIEESCGGCYE